MDFETPNISVMGGELAIYIRDADLVQIDERDFADPAAGEGFGCPRANPSDSDYGDMSLMKTRECVLSVETGKAGKSIEVAGWKFRIQSGEPCGELGIDASCRR